MPDWHMQPRMALGFSLKSLLALMSDRRGLLEVAELAKKLHPSRHEASGKSLAKRMYGSVPLIYSSLRNEAVAVNWKIRFNESGKIPAFYNVLPELNHNEMTGFSAGGGSALGGDVHSEIRKLSKRFHFIFLKDVEDDKRIVRRMNILEKLYHDRGFKVEVMFLQGETRLQKIFSSLNLADWAAYYTAKQYDVDPQEVPMVDEFKRLTAGM
jgi:glucose/mannose-6-phosphate isomerase